MSRCDFCDPKGEWVGCAGVAGCNLTLNVHGQDLCALDILLNVVLWDALNIHRGKQRVSRRKGHRGPGAATRFYFLSRVLTASRLPCGGKLG